MSATDVHRLGDCLPDDDKGEKVRGKVNLQKLLTPTVLIAGIMVTVIAGVYYVLGKKGDDIAAAFNRNEGANKKMWDEADRETNPEGEYRDYCSAKFEERHAGKHSAFPMLQYGLAAGKYSDVIACAEELKRTSLVDVHSARMSQLYALMKRAELMGPGDTRRGVDIETARNEARLAAEENPGGEIETAFVVYFADLAGDDEAARVALSRVPTGKVSLAANLEGARKRIRECATDLDTEGWVSLMHQKWRQTEHEKLLAVQLKVGQKNPVAAVPRP